MVGWSKFFGRHRILTQTVVYGLLHIYQNILQSFDLLLIAARVHRVTISIPIVWLSELIRIKLRDERVG